ncbi:hypothetical protein HHI36_015538 [Cryptolaemus montrouzieri]|uniref:Uncharacterized protein n=1 Tax=Cryptolaemus montrouzieri TaxID=559131 RepID=A0ABD2N6E8_9CUCU
MIKKKSSRGITKISKTYEKVTSSEKTLPKRRSRVKRISNCIKDTNEENKLKKNINSDETIEDISETNNSLVLEEKIKTSTTKQVEAVVEHNQVEEENKNLIISEPLDCAATTVDDSNIEQKGNSNNTDTIEGNQTEDKMSSAENNEEVTNFSQQKSNTGSNIELSHSEQEITPSVKENKNILLENVS